LELQNLATDVDGDLLGQVAFRDGDRHVGDVANLVREVRRHRVDVVREVLPNACDTGDLGLAAELSVRTDLARDAAHLRGESVELIAHRVDGDLQLQDFSFDVDGDLAREVPACHGCSHFGNVADLTREVRRHRVHVVGQVLPYACN